MTEAISTYQTSKTYRCTRENIQGSIDKAEALKQSLQKMLATKRYQCPLYGFYYGVDWDGLLGKDSNYVKVEAKRQITEALLCDDRVENVSDFIFTQEGDLLQVEFDVTSVFGSLHMEQEVKL